MYDAEGCPASDSLLIAVQPRVFAPNVIRPGSSGGNDRFTLFSKDALPIQSLRIFDRWGELVFENQNFMTNDPASGWDGTRPGRQDASALPVAASNGLLRIVSLSDFSCSTILSSCSPEGRAH